MINPITTQDWSWPTLVGERVRLRRIDPREAPAVYPHMADADLWRYRNIDAPGSVADVAAYIDNCCERPFTTHESLVLGLEWLTTRQVVGMAGLLRIDPVGQHAELGALWLTRSLWGRGVAHEACRLLIDYAFGPLALRRLEVLIYAGNTRSLRCFERLGARLCATSEGTLRGRSWQRHHLEIHSPVTEALPPASTL
jgi:RimJ/RimL family protein N-acetyltransferase